MTKIRQKYSCKGDVLLNIAIQMLMEAGTESLKDADYVRGAIDHVNAMHDKAEQQGKTLAVTREFEVAIWECVAELAMLELPEILAYIQTEMCWFAKDKIPYRRLKELLDGCLCELSEASFYYEPDDVEVLERFRCAELEDDEIEQLGYGYLLEMEEEDDENY